MATPPVLYVHASAEGAVFVVRPDGSMGWITLAELDTTLEALAAAGGRAMASLEGGREAPPAAHALLRRMINTVDTRTLAEHHPEVTPLPEGVTRLMAFAHAGRVDLIEDLVTRGADVNVTDSHGTTPLHYAANNGQAAAAAALLRAGADPNRPDADGIAPLLYAAERGHAAVVRELLLGGADPSVEGPNGYTALDLAEGAEHGDVVAALRQVLRRRT